MSLEVETINEPNDREKIGQEVLEDLLEWFGLPESTEASIKESRDLELKAAYVEDEVVGFVTIKPTSEETAEIHAVDVKMALQNERHLGICGTNGILVYLW